MLWNLSSLFKFRHNIIVAGIAEDDHSGCIADFVSLLPIRRAKYEDHA